MRACIVLLVALITFHPASAAPASDDVHACDVAAARAERAWGLPTGILAAVGAVESGRQRSDAGAAPWPWTINAAGRGAFFESKPEAIGAVLAVMQRGYPYIDVGCFQIDIAYHPDVFRSLDDAFDPDRNADAAARLLLAERAHALDWATAVARYHSATPGLGGPYLERVRSALPRARLRGLDAQYWLELEAAEARAESGSRTGASSGRAATMPAVIYPPQLPLATRGPQIIRIAPADKPTEVVAAEFSAARTSP